MQYFVVTIDYGRRGREAAHEQQVVGRRRCQTMTLTECGGGLSRIG